MQAEFLKTAQTIADAVRDLPTIEVSIAQGPVANRVPHLLLRYDQHQIRVAPTDVTEELRRGEPSIELNPATGGKDATSGLPADENTIVVGVWMLQPGEEDIVARRLREVLARHVAE
jgi:L-seryl-tRNA(Ser) seleniumtransferase